MADLVLDLLDRRPIWAIPSWAVETIRKTLPRGWTLHQATTPADGSGDGGKGGPSSEVLEALQGARVYVGYGVPPAILEAGGESLRWVHTGTAGVGGSLHPAMVEALEGGRLQFTNSAGIHGPPMAETVLAMLLHFCRGLDLAGAAQREGRWNSAPFFRADAPVVELAHLRVGILGYGGIGQEVGACLRALGCRVTGLRRSPVEPGQVDIHGVELLSGMGEEGLGQLLDTSDALVITAPETAETRGVLTRERLRRLPRGAMVVNVARGSLVDEEALVEALEDGHLRGAGLDVFATEPLPEGHPLWALPNALLTPHVSGVSRGFWAREVALVVENLRRHLAGEELLNRVRPDRGY